MNVVLYLNVVNISKLPEVIPGLFSLENCLLIMNCMKPCHFFFFGKYYYYHLVQGPSSLKYNCIIH